MYKAFKLGNWWNFRFPSGASVFCFFLVLTLFCLLVFLLSSYYPHSLLFLLPPLSPVFPLSVQIPTFCDIEMDQFDSHRTKCGSLIGRSIVLTSNSRMKLFCSSILYQTVCHRPPQARLLNPLRNVLTELRFAELDWSRSSSHQMGVIALTGFVWTV